MTSIRNCHEVNNFGAFNLCCYALSVVNGKLILNWKFWLIMYRFSLRFDALRTFCECQASWLVPAGHATLFPLIVHCLLRNKHRYIATFGIVKNLCKLNCFISFIQCIYFKLNICMHNNLFLSSPNNAVYPFYIHKKILSQLLCKLRSSVLSCDLTQIG